MKSLCLLFVFIVASCDHKIQSNETMVFVSIEKAISKDGLYLNRSDPELLSLKYSGEVLRFFSELDTSKRQAISYTEAYSLMKKDIRNHIMISCPQILTHLPALILIKQLLLIR